MSSVPVDMVPYLTHQDTTTQPTGQPVTDGWYGWAESWFDDWLDDTKRGVGVVYDTITASAGWADDMVDGLVGGAQNFLTATGETVRTVVADLPDAVIDASEKAVQFTGNLGDAIGDFWSSALLEPLGRFFSDNIVIVIAGGAAIGLIVFYLDDLLALAGEVL